MISFADLPYKSSFLFLLLLLLSVSLDQIGLVGKSCNTDNNYIKQHILLTKFSWSGNWLWGVSE